MKGDEEVRLAFVTAPSIKAARSLVRTLVEEKVIACGNILPGVTSIYRWEGEIETEEEVLIVMKTMVSAVPRLLERAPELHPYEVPEVLVVPVDAGHGPYMAWVNANTESSEDRG